MQNICSEFFCKIDAEIKNIENNFDNPIDQSKHLVTYLEDKLKELFSWLENHTFSSEENEIYFFKKLKYRLTSKYIYNHKIIEIESSAPSTNKKLKIKYYKEVIRNCHLESIKDKEFYKYYRSGYSHYDHLYFTRNSAIQTLNKHITTIYLDIRKCSLYDYKVAIINANDMLTEYCEKKINQLNNVVTLSDTISNLNWSGSKVDLVELIYALHQSKSINAGNIDVIEMASAFGKIFNIGIEEGIYRSYQDIKARKIVKTKFLNSITENLNKKMIEEEN